MNPWIKFVIETPTPQPLESAAEAVRPAAPPMARADAGRYRAKCEACGHSWRLNQHDRIVCPYCYNEPSDVAFHGSFVLLADEASRRWFS